MRPEFEGRSVGLFYARAPATDSCFRWREPPKLAHGRQGTLEGSWRGVIGIRRASCRFGVDAPRGGFTRPLRSRERTSSSAPGRAQPRQTGMSAAR